MSYVLNQFFQKYEDTPIPISTNAELDGETTYLKLKKDFVAFDPGTVTDPEKYKSAVIEEAKTQGHLLHTDLVNRVETRTDSQVTGIGALPFKNECIYFADNSLENGKSYYFHGKIKRMSDEQVFDIKLVHKNNQSTGLQEETQYIKQARVRGGDISEWVDIEFIFTPIKNFDGIRFDLYRTSTDYRIETRFAIIAYLELSLIKNISIFNVNGGKIHPMKIGVVTRPGFLMCINNEEIRTSRTGIYELKNGTIVVNFFSVASAAKENDTYAERWMAEVNKKIADIVQQQEDGEIDDEEAQKAKSYILSAAFYGTSKNRVTDPFTLDYMYNVNYEPKEETSVSNTTENNG